jgi:hypothetical protein
MLLIGLVAAPVCLLIWLLWPRLRHLWKRLSQSEPTQNQSQHPTAPQATPQRATQSSVTVRPAPVLPPVIPPVHLPARLPVSEQVQPPSSQPPSSLGLDEPDAIRPDISPLAVNQTRSGLAYEVPDALLADALLDATPEQIKTLIGAVPAEVMAGIMGHGSVYGAHNHSSDHSGNQANLTQAGSGSALNELKGLETAVDDLDIWSFGLQD